MPAKYKAPSLGERTRPEGHRREAITGQDIPGPRGGHGGAGVAGGLGAPNPFWEEEGGGERVGRRG